jgi:hypothetical protein
MASNGLKPKKQSELFLLVSGTEMLLTDRFCIFKSNCSAQKRPRQLKLVSLEPSGNADSEYSSKFFLHVCEQNGIAKCLATPFSRALGGGGANWPTELVEIATLYKFYEYDRFSTSSCDPCMGHTLKLFKNTFHHKKDTKDGF